LPGPIQTTALFLIALFLKPCKSIFRIWYGHQVQSIGTTLYIHGAIIKLTLNAIPEPCM